MIGIEIKVDDEKVQRLLINLSKKVGNLSPIMREIAGIMHDAVEENFEKQGRPRWKPLRPSTIEARKKKGYWPGKILQQRGRLAASISRKYDNNSARVGTNLEYAAIHQFGGLAGRGHKAKIPARPFLKLTRQDMSDIKEVLRKYLK